MDVFEAIQKRRSVRKYLDKEVPMELILKVLEAGRLAPSAHNSQPWHYIIVTDPEKRKKIAESGKWAGFLKNTPVVIVGCGDPEASPNWYMVDVTISMQNMVLEATELGLGTCWVGSFDQDTVKKLLNIPEKYKVVALLALGYPAEGIEITSKILHTVRPRKKLEEIYSLNEFKK
ncbi:MAG: nitroreductase family protein [Nitrososphaeria archaeon]|nr:nitroreductase family protein [Nitrososphaeria archaeon]